jgi:pilus assembly protein CpaC
VALRAACCAIAVFFPACYFAFAQPPAKGRRPAPPADCRETPMLDPVINRGPRPAQELKAFAKEVTSNDAQFEVFVGQGRLLTLKADMVDPKKQSPLIATGDPSVIDFEVVGPRQLRITGRRIGVTDLSIVTQDNENYSFEVHVVANLEYLDARLKQLFPDASLQLSHLRDHVVVSGQARDTRQVSQIIDTITAYLTSIQNAQATKYRAATGLSGRTGADQPPTPHPPDDATSELMRAEVLSGGTVRPDIEAQSLAPTVINLIHVPGPGQVLLRVQVAELNRTAVRQLGASLLFQGNNFAVGHIVGPPLPRVPAATPGIDVSSMAGLLGLTNPLTAGTTSTVFGLFDSGHVNAFLAALRKNDVLKILAEPNLVAMNGEEATFLSGGEFPVPVPQPTSAGVGLVTIQYKTFGVSLAFVPYILDDETIRLAVAPEVSSIDFTTGVTIQGTQVPGINTRRTSTVVEMREGQTLAISGILQVTLAGTTARVPGLGDLPYIGPLFSNNSTQMVEKELVIMVTPYLVDAMEPEQVPPRPGDEVVSPDDCEFYMLGYIEGRSCEPFRATTNWENPLGLGECCCRRKLESDYVSGPYGYSE